MSNAVQTRTLVPVILAAMKAAWNVPCDLGKPKTPHKGSYGVLRIKPIASRIGAGIAGAGQVQQLNTFEIYYLGLNPTDPTKLIELEKIDRANELIALLQASAKLRDANNVAVASDPLVSVVDPDVEEGDDEARYMVSLTFSCLTVGTHH